MTMRPIELTLEDLKVRAENTRIEMVNRMWKMEIALTKIADLENSKDDDPLGEAIEIATTCLLEVKA